jgi:hypothetical protein
MGDSSEFYTFGRCKVNSPTDEDIVKAIKETEEDNINSRNTKIYRPFKLSKVDLGPIMMVGVSIIAVAMFVGIDKYLEQKHIDSGTPYIRFMKPEGYLIETLKLKDGTTWDVLCIDGVKTIYDIDKRLVSETNLVCY